MEEAAACEVAHRNVRKIYAQMREVKAKIAVFTEKAADLDLQYKAAKTVLKEAASKRRAAVAGLNTCTMKLRHRRNKP